MRKKSVIKYFGSVKQVSEMLGVSTQAVYSWPALVPKGSAADLDKLTDGKLHYDPKDYRNSRRTHPVPSPQTP